MRARHLLQALCFAVVVAPFMALFIGLRVAEDEEREGLDIASHGEQAYRFN